MGVFGFSILLLSNELLDRLHSFKYPCLPHNSRAPTFTLPMKYPASSPVDTNCEADHAFAQLFLRKAPGKRFCFYERDPGDKECGGWCVG